MTPPVGKAIVRIDDDRIKERMRDLLAQAWDEGWCAATSVFTQGVVSSPNPYRDEAQA
jgi:hypothetical protein